MKKLKKYGAALLALLLAAGTLGGCSAREKKWERQWFDWFDTFSTLTVYTNDKDAFEEYATLCETYLEEYHQLLDIYEKYEGVNNLKTVNDHAGETVTVSPRLGEFLQFAKEMDELTAHTTNVGMGSVLSLWHQARETANRSPDLAALPDADAIASALTHTDLSHLTLSEDKTEVCLTDPEMSLDAGALGKGYVAGQIRDALLAAGCQSFLLNLGGNTVAHGEKPDGSTWLVGIESPAEGIEYNDSLALQNAVLVTSGSYHRYFTVDGVRYHHIIDPVSGYPENRFLSVSILATDPALADALSTALFCLTEEEGRALIRSMEDVEVLWIYENGMMSETDGWSDFAKGGTQ